MILNLRRPPLAELFFGQSPSDSALHHIGDFRVQNMIRCEVLALCAFKHCISKMINTGSWDTEEYGGLDEVHVRLFFYTKRGKF